MSDFDLLVRGRERDIGIVDGKFAAIAPNLRGSASEEIDATKMSIFPGVIDSHVHFNEPGRTDWEGFETGSRAAAAGGTTTIFEMPLNAHPPTIDGASFDAKRVAAEKSSLVDFGLWGGLIPGNLDQLETLRDRGVVGLKAFMCNSGVDDFPHVTMSILHDGMKRAAALDLLVAVHAESEEMTQRLTLEKLAAGKTTVADYLESRPVEAELDAIQCAVDLAHETGCRLHIVHVSCGRGVELVIAARANGVNVTCETCPHYLLFTGGDMKKIGAMAKCAPPLRDLLEHRALWRRLDKVTTIGSDHSPSPPEMKQRENFFEVWGGISGAQHLLPLLADKIPHEQLAKLTSESVAQRFGIAQKDGIAIGKDADLSIVDLADVDVVTAESLHYRHKQSPYLGRKLPRIVRTILRGQTIYHGGKLAAQPIGRFVRPPP
ncbi:MAG: allantoinase AllB [Verrucomicrobiota bacterium]|nr:allantoinase AllB [Verrucomicrobiota bacterium]